MIGLSVYYALAMVIPTLYHRKDLQGPFLFVSFLLPASFLVSMISFWVTHSYALFMVVNAFMLVLHYLIGQRDSFRV
ncbi:MAG: diguanylate cyclase, partial [Sphaerochaeta sp.]